VNGHQNQDFSMQKIFTSRQPLTAFNVAVFAMLVQSKITLGNLEMSVWQKQKKDKLKRI
jgi:hypothetical protein